MSAHDQQPKGIDLDAAARLVEMLERDLALARAGGDLARVRAEVEQLRALLAAHRPQQEVHEGFGRLREALHALREELARDAFEVGDYIARIGRLLGL